MLFEYENLSIESYEVPYLGNENENQSFLLFNAPQNQSIKSEFSEIESSMANPFKVLKLWLQYEIYEIDALFECFTKRKEVQKCYDNCMDVAQSKLGELNKLESGEMTLNTWWKSK